MATRFGIRNYSRNGNQVTFTVVALNAHGSIDTSYAGNFMLSGTNLTGLPAGYTFVGGDQGQRVFTATITNSNGSASAAAVFPGGTGTGANLHIASPAGTNTSFFFSGDHVMHGGAGNDTYSGSSGNDLMHFELGGNDVGNGNGGNDGFYFGGAYTVEDRVNGGDGFDSIGLQGNYSAGVTLGSMLNTELVVLMPGNDRRFGDTNDFTYSYNLTANANTIVSNNRLTIQGNALRSSEDFTFDGSATAIDCLIYGGAGADRLTGGSGDDGFFFGQNRLGSSDVINGGAGIDQLGLQGAFNFSFGRNQLSGIEYLVLLSASDNRFGSSGGAARYDISMNDGNLQAGERMIVQANTLRAGETLSFNGLNEVDGTFQIFSGAADDLLGGSQGADDIHGGAGNDIIQGFFGADTLRGGAGNDTFYYSSIRDSAPDAYDRILDFTLGDLIDLTGISPNQGGTFSFIGSNAPTGQNQLQVIQNGGAATVNLFLDADATPDLVIEVTVADSHVLTRADFLGVPANQPMATIASGHVERAPDVLLSDHGAWVVEPDWHSCHANAYGRTFATTHDLLI